MNIGNRILEVTNASAITHVQDVQSLWSGYGKIQRYFLEGGKHPSIIVKHIDLSRGQKHPKGWDTRLSHERKLRSYKVERSWYEKYVSHTDNTCRVPESYHSFEDESSILLIMEDLDASGFDKRLHHDLVTLTEAKRCLKWLASFHAKFMGNKGADLWPVGTYWHLETRPDELSKMNNIALKQVANDIDEKLNCAKYQTLVHGDAKLANFCFGSSGKVAAVDFQYVGKGCGMKDVAYFISSCFEEDQCEMYEEELLNYYFDQLEVFANNVSDYQLLKNEWAELYRYAWADFYRFLDGWNPGHWKMHGYSKRITERVISELGSHEP